MTKLPKGGNLHGSNASAAPIIEPRDNRSPRAGQSGTPYKSGESVRNVHQKPTKNPGGAASKQTGHAASKPKQRGY